MHPSLLGYLKDEADGYRIGGFQAIGPKLYSMKYCEKNSENIVSQQSRIKGLTIKSPNVTEKVNYELLQDFVCQLQAGKSPEIIVPQTSFKIERKSMSISTHQYNKVLRRSTDMPKRFLNLNQRHPSLLFAYGCSNWDECNVTENLDILADELKS